MSKLDYLMKISEFQIYKKVPNHLSFLDSNARTSLNFNTERESGTSTVYLNGINDDVTPSDTESNGSCSSDDKNQLYL